MALTGPPSAAPRGVAFITRLKTGNKGNEALSGEWLRLLQSHLPSGGLRIAPRVPDHLLQFNLDALRNPAQAPDLFRGWAERTIRDWAAAPPEPAPSLPPSIVLDERHRVDDTWLTSLKQRLNIRSRLARLGTFRREYGSRLSAFSDAGCVILNPAGEFWSTARDIPLRHLLDIYIAKRLGCRTAIVNHTFELAEPILLEVAKLVYGSMDLISVREEQSKRRLTDLGIDADKILVAPDLVFMTDPVPLAKQASGSPHIAICPNSAYLANAADEWGHLVGKLLEKGWKVSLVTNDFPIDRATLDRLSTSFRLPQLGEGMSYRQYSGLLGTFDAVVSSRLHSCVMGLTGGAPVVPIEGLQFKITAAMAAAGVPVPAVRPSTAGWQDSAMASIESVLSDPGKARGWVRAVVERQRQGIATFLDQVNVRLSLVPAAAAA